jgi:hypothetical protein
MKVSELRKLIREVAQEYITEKTADEIKNDKDTVDAQLIAAKAKLKAAMANVKVAKEQISALTKKKSEVATEQPTEEV